MESNERMFDQRTFDEKEIKCPKCGWKGKGEQTNVAGFYGLGKFQEVMCPKCDELLGNLTRDHSFGEGGKP